LENKNSSELLIEQLSRELKPVKGLSSPLRWSATLLGAALLVILAALFISGPRAGLSETFLDAGFDFNLLCSLALLISSLLLSSLLSRPGARAKVAGSFALLATLLLLAFNLGAIGTSAFTARAAVDSGNGQACGLFVVLIAASLGTLFLFRARAGAPTKPWLVGATIGLASFAAGSIGIALHCGNENALHIGLWHVGIPAMIVVGLGAILGQRVLRW
jgi:hypothetical protein